MIGLKICLLTISYKGLQTLAYIQDFLFSQFKVLNLKIYEGLLRLSANHHCKVLSLKSRGNIKYEDYDSFEEVE